MEEMPLEWIETPTHLIVKVSTVQLWVANANSFKKKTLDKLKNLTAKGAPPYFLIDLEDVTFIDSLGLGSLLAIYKAYGAQLPIALCIQHSFVKQVFDMTHMQNVMPIYPSVAEAMHALSLAPQPKN